jgi:hypothetical protein
MRILGGLLFMWGRRFTKKHGFGSPKMEKELFVGRNKNQPPWRSLPYQGPHACLIWPCSDNLCYDQGRT